MTIKTNFGERLTELIIERKIDVSILSRDTGFLQSEIYHWRQEKYFPSLTNLVILADYFNITVDYLLGLENESQNITFNDCPIFKDQFIYIMQNNNTNIHKLSKVSGVDRNTIYSWLNGKRQPQVDALIKVSSALNISLNYLIGREK